MSTITSKIALYDGSSSFFSLDANILEGVLCNALSDPTYLSFRVFFDFDATSGLLAEEIEDYSERSVQNCALAWFKRIGDEVRYQELKKFIALLKAIQNSAFHCFESVSGLKDAWQRQMKDVLLKDKFVEFKLTESVDWRFASLWSLLRHISYDYERMVSVLPQNLRQFNMTVWVTEMRIFNENIDDKLQYHDDNRKVFGNSVESFGNDTLTVYNQSQTNAEKLKNVYKILGTSTAASGWPTQRDVSVKIDMGAYAMFGFNNCEFDLSSGANFFSDIDKTNDAPMASNNMKVKYGNCVIAERMPIIGSISEFVVDDMMLDATQSQQLKSHNDKIKQHFEDNIYGLDVDETLEDVGVGAAYLSANVDVEGKLSLKQIVKQVVKQAAEQVIDFAKDTANNYIDSAIENAKATAKQQASRLAGKAIGSAYGFNAAQLYALTNPQYALAKTIAGIKSVDITGKPITNIKQQFDNQGSAFDKPVVLSNNVPHQSMYPSHEVSKATRRLGSAFSKDSM